MNNFDEMTEVIKECSVKLGSSKIITGGLFTLEFTHKCKHYNMDYGRYKGNIFFVLIDLDAESKYKYMCSVNNFINVQYDTFELYIEGDEPSAYVPFPDEFTQDAYFNIMTIHNMHNVPLELLQVAHEFYSLVKAKF